jgi:hypothetical protein
LDTFLGPALPFAESIQFMHQPFRVNPTERVKADVELAGVVAEDCRVNDELLDVDGDIDAHKFLTAAPPEAAETIDYLVDVYDRTSWGIFSSIFRHRGPSLAWAYIFLDREYAVADTLGYDIGIEFANYSVLSHPNFPSEKHSVGYLWIKDKATLAGITATSLLWAECWRVSADASAAKHHIAILDPLPKDWSYRNENGSVFNVWYEMKVHAAPGKKSIERH